MCESGRGRDTSTGDLDECRAPAWSDGRRRSVAFVGTYPPTLCGLATFTQNLRAAVAAAEPRWRTGIVRIIDHWEPVPSVEVVEQWISCDPVSLRRTRAMLRTFDVVVLQHEFGIFGGLDGDEVLDLVDGLGVPLIVVLHTALGQPGAHKNEVLDGLLKEADLAVVQSNAARRCILDTQVVDAGRVVVVPHGAASNFWGPRLTDVPHPSLLTWGLLGPGKGIEQGIAAVANLRWNRPAPTYVVAGRTHPKVRTSQDDMYLRQLRQLACSLGVSERVLFETTYLDGDLLRALIRSVDAVLLPYDSHQQVTSGVLVEAIASGRPIIATRFPHAEELLADGAGILVDHGDVGAIASALEHVLYDPEKSNELSERARSIAGPLLWPSVGSSYSELIDRVASRRVTVRASNRQGTVATTLSVDPG